MLLPNGSAKLPQFVADLAQARQGLRRQAARGRRDKPRATPILRIAQPRVAVALEQLQNLGYNMVIYPVTAFRLALKAVEDGLRSIDEKGTQDHLLDKMQHRKRLYEILHYEAYGRIDEKIYNFDK